MVLEGSPSKQVNRPGRKQIPEEYMRPQNFDASLRSMSMSKPSKSRSPSKPKSKAE